MRDLSFLRENCDLWKSGSRDQGRIRINSGREFNESSGVFESEENEENDDADDENNQNNEDFLEYLDYVFI